MPAALVAFTFESRVEGSIPLADDRLTDMLNAVTRIVVRDASVTDLDSACQTAGDVLIEAGHLVAVVATGRTGMASQRRRTSVTRIRVDLDRYAVTGFLHRPVGERDGPCSGRPERVFEGRDVLVPLTCASISYECGGRLMVEEHGTILVNRSLATWVDLLEADEEVGPPTRWTGRSRYLKDLTGLPTS